MKFSRICAVLLVSVASLPGQVAPRLVYHVEVKAEEIADRRGKAAFHHALDIDQPQMDEVRLSVAAWAPGSYRLMNVFKNLDDVAAVDERGAQRPVRKDGDLTWIVDARGAERLRVTWRFEEATRGVNNRSYLNDTGALLDGPRNYLYWRDHKELPAHVHFKLPDGWKLATGLTPTFDPAVFQARDADWLLDCPVLMGRLEGWTFYERGVPHRVAVDNRGRKVEFDAAKFVDSIRKIVKAEVDLWGFVPYPHYTFLFSAGGGGGLEHLTSTTIGINASALQSNPNAHQDVIAHEFFHAWNVKRLRPKALGPFDYDGPVRTKSLWISEGITEYYTTVALARAGLVDDEEFLAAFARTISGFIANPASRRVSPEEASWTVWDGPYLGGPISYYTQGEILGLLMDLQIRGETKNRKSLDDAMRLLYQRYSGPVGFQSEDVVTTIRDATGVDLHAFFLKHVSGAREIEWEKYFRWMGCVAKAARRPRSAISFSMAQGGDEGVTVKIPEDSALFRMGLRDGDVVTSVNSVAVKSARELRDALRKIEIGAQAEIGAKRGTEPISLNGAMEAATDLSEVSFRRGDRLLVQRLPEDSPLVDSGLRDGDVVTAIDGVAIKTLEEWRATVAKIREGQAVKLLVDRGGSEQTIRHTASTAVVVSFSLTEDPAATPLELEIRNAIIHGPPQPAAAAIESRPVRKAG